MDDKRTNNPSSKSKLSAKTKRTKRSSEEEAPSTKAITKESVKQTVKSTKADNEVKVATFAVLDKLWEITSAQRPIDRKKIKYGSTANSIAR